MGRGYEGALYPLPAGAWQTAEAQIQALEAEMG